jgi:hypothetical protein
MRTFAIGWLLAFCLVGAVAYGIGSAVRATTSPPTPTPVRFSDYSERMGEVPVTFTEGMAVDVVSRRFGSTARAEALREELRTTARLSPHSIGHWTVCLDSACWTAHGPGRYAEPDNDAARAREAEAAAGP